MMDGNDRPSDSEQDSFDFEQSVHGQSTDAFLQQLVHLVNTTPVILDVTLTLGGNVITGTLIGGKRYHQEFADSISIAWPHREAGELVRDAFASWVGLYDNVDELARRPPQYIHLINAHYLTANAKFPNTGMLWRGRINAVSGFTLGRFTLD